MQIFEHVRLLKSIKILLLIPLTGVTLAFPSIITCSICLTVFIITLIDFIVIDKAFHDYQLLYHSAYYDGITNIPNRLSADVFVAKSTSPDDMSVIIADLDGLKATNDTYGHAVGDILIRDFATLFFHSAYPEGFAARNGGDEFLAIFPKDGDGAKAAEYCKKLQEAVTEHNASSDYPLHYSIGYACGQDSSYESVQQLISEADSRMYQEKVKKKASRPVEILRKEEDADEKAFEKTRRP